MSEQHKKILVTGATGQQGGATATALLSRGWEVRALTRNPSGDAAKALKRSGAEVVSGDLSDRSSLEVAMAGVHGVFSVQPTIVSSVDPGADDPEVGWGVNVADAAYAAGVQHLVYASGSGADENTGLRNLENKARIERHIRDIGLPATILRPVSFMENYLRMVPGQGIEAGELVTAVKAETVQPLIALADIGVFAALAFERPDDFVGRSIELAGDELTPPRMAQALSRATGRSIRYVEITSESFAGQSAELVRAYELLNERVSRADRDWLRKFHPSLMTFESWLEQTTVFVAPDGCWSGS